MDNTTKYLVETWQPPGLLSQATQIIKDATLRQILSYVLVGLIAYPTIVSLLRFRRLKKLHEKYHYPTRESMAQMTDNDAWEIQKAVSELEFPFMYIKALQFALFRVRCIHSLRLVFPFLTSHICSGILTLTTDLRNPHHIQPSSWNRPILEPAQVSKEIRRHIRLDRRVRRIRTHLRPIPERHCAGQLPAQRIPQHGEDPRG